MHNFFILIFLSLFFSGFSQDTLDLREDKKVSGMKKTPKSSLKKENYQDEQLQQNVQLQLTETFKTASQYFFITSKKKDRKSFNNKEIKQMNKMVEELESMDANSFEYNFYKYLSGHYDISLFPYLEKAYELNPKSIDVQKQLVAYYYIQSDFEKTENHLGLLFDGNYLPVSLIDYGQDLLASVPQNGILITHGVEDTYAVLFLQYNMGVRNDVEVISLDLLQSETYRDKLKVKSFKLPTFNFIDVKYYAEFCQLNSGKNIVTSLTVPKEYLISLAKNQYISGLVMLYSVTPLNNIPKNELLWLNGLSFRLLQNDDDKSKELAMNYLPMLFQLRRFYYSNGEDNQGKKIDELIDRIAVFSGKKQKVQSLKEKF